MRSSSYAPLLALTLVVACSSGGAATADGGTARRSSSSVITLEDLATVQELSALDAIRRLRPNWVRGRAIATPASGGNTEPALRLDGVVRGDISELASIPVRDVQEVRFISAADATTLYGTGYTSGIIDVRLRTR